MFLKKTLNLPIRCISHYKGQRSLLFSKTLYSVEKKSGIFAAPITGNSFAKRLLSELPSDDFKFSQLRNFSSEEEIPLLSKVIERELNDEDEVGNCQMPEHLSELHADISRFWSITIDNSSNFSATVKLIQKRSMIGGGKVSLLFHCQDTIDYDDAIYDSDDNHNGNNSNDQEGSASVRFDIYIFRNCKTMKITCSAHDSEVSVESVLVFNGNLTVDDDDKNQYRGPNLDELPEDMQEGLLNYVTETCGVDRNVAAFISMFADFQEQKEYIKWLKDVKTIIA